MCVAACCSAQQPSPSQQPSTSQEPSATSDRPAPKRSGWLKVQLHAHSGRSGDSATPPRDVAAWYARHGYDAVVLTDHNVASTPPTSSALALLPGVELTHNLRDCTPMPRPGFGCLLHVNALAIEPRTEPEPPWAPLDAESERQPPTRAAVFARSIKTSRALGGVAMLNHPNFHAAADADLIAALVRDHDLRLFEVANEAVDSDNTPADRPSTEALWDDVLSRGLTLYGVATDDAHHYDDAVAVRARGELAHTGDRGFVMVRADAPSNTAVREALREGRFYSSTGLVLKDVRVQDGALVIDLPERCAQTCTTRFIGQGGAQLGPIQKGTTARFALSDAPPGYVRAVVTSSDGARALVQPVRVPEQGSRPE